MLVLVRCGLQLESSIRPQGNGRRIVRVEHCVSFTVNMLQNTFLRPLNEILNDEF